MPRSHWRCWPLRYAPTSHGLRLPSSSKARLDSILGPGIAAISLGLVGHDALAERLGRNRRFASIGGLAAAAFMGVIGYLLSTQDIFLVAAALAAPLLFALTRIRASDIHFARSCGGSDHHAADPARVQVAPICSKIVVF